MNIVVVVVIVVVLDIVVVMIVVLVLVVVFVMVVVIVVVMLVVVVVVVIVLVVVFVMVVVVVVVVVFKAYQFFFQVMESLLQAHPTVISIREHCAKLLGHEATRVFHDRLVNEADRKFFFKVLSDELHIGFRVRWSQDQLQHEPFVFGDFLDTSSPHSTRVYRFTRSYDRLPKVLEVCFIYV